MWRFLCGLVSVVSVAAVIGTGASALALTPSSEVILIDSISVGAPTFNTNDTCSGQQQWSKPVVPVTIVATFIQPPGEDPLGPYATSEWDGGYGSWDDHFDTAEAHDHVQFFHVLMTADPLAGFHGQGHYQVTATVQDVGPSPAMSTASRDFTLPALSPSFVSKIKCTLHQAFDPRKFADGILWSTEKKLFFDACALCKAGKTLWDTAKAYSQIADHYMRLGIEQDPPDNNYDQLAPATPLPLVAPPSGLPDAQLTAWQNLEAELAAQAGRARAIATTFNRIWGADNAANPYWYRAQLRYLGQLAADTATGYDGLPALWQAFTTSIESEVLPFSITTEDSVGAYLDLRSNGLPTEFADLFTQLGQTSDDQAEILDSAMTQDVNKLTATDGVAALFSEDDSNEATALRTLASWVGTAAQEPRPQIASVSPSTLPSAGGGPVTVTGVNLSDVSGIDFGPSTPNSGAGAISSCSPTRCTVYAPPGHGTVDVVAVGPGGPSDLVPADQVSYVEPAAPQITAVSPSSGPTAGGTSVTIQGTGLDQGEVYFGAAPAPTWSCGSSTCTAQSPASGAAGAVDVSVYTARGTSPTTPADRFTYVPAGPPPGAPTVTGVTPNHGTDLGGDLVTITGTNFTGASRVDFGTGEVYDPTVLDDSHMQVTAPSGNPSATVDVVVEGPGGASAPVAADQYTYSAGTGPTVTGITPNTGADIGGTLVTVTGTELTGGHLYFGDVPAPDSACTVGQCTGTAPPAPNGSVDVHVQTRDGTSAATPSDTFTYTAGPLPVITSVAPDAGPTNGGNDVLVRGQNLNAGTVTIGGRQAANPGDVYADSPCTATSCVVQAPQGAAGPADVRVTTMAGTSAAVAADVYTYVPSPPPVVTGITPSVGGIAGDQELDVYGTDLDAGTVYVNGQQAYPVSSWGQSCNHTSCSVKTPPQSSTGVVDVTVTTPAGTSATSPADRYTVRRPTITSITPATGWTEGNNAVTVTGTDLTGATVIFGDTSSPSAACTSATTCTVKAPYVPVTQTGTVDVTASGPDGTSPVVTADRYTYTARPAPAVTSVSPSTGTTGGNEAITVGGTALLGGIVLFNGIRVAADCSSNTSCAVTTRPWSTPATVDITVNTTAGSSTVNPADQFTYVNPQPPTVTGVSPASGPSAGGTQVTITGTNLSNGVVKFGTTSAAPATCTRTQCTVTAPAHGAGAVDVTVTVNGAGTSAVSNADTFTYVVPPVPAVASITPAGGPMTGGEQVTITGTDLTGGSVSFGGTAGAGVTCTATVCRAIAPAGTGAVDVTVTTPGGTSATGSQDRFTYNTVSLTEHPIPGATTAAGGGQIVRGIAGDLWFTMPSLDSVGRIAADGTITRYALATGAKPVGICYGPDGAMWVAEQNADTVVRIDGTGAMTPFPVGGEPNDIRQITSGPDGRLWFTYGTSGTIGAMTTAGTVSLYHLPDPTVLPYNLVTGADGRIWFAEYAGDSVGAITTSGVVTEYPIPVAAGGSWGITRGPDNRVWLAESTAASLVAVSTDGTATAYRLPETSLNVTNPQGLVTGPDGRIWFAAPNIDQVSAFDPKTGQRTDYAFPGGASGNEQPRYLAMDGTGNLWLTQFGGKNVTEVSGIVAPVAPTVTDVTPPVGLAGTTVGITGTNLGGATSVTFGGVAATFTVVDPAHITATVPSGPTGTVDVVVHTPNGASPAASYTYGTPAPLAPTVTHVSPDVGPDTGGTAITVTGANLAGASISVGGNPATGVSCTASTCHAVTPAGSDGTVDVVATVGGVSSATSTADRFTYVVPTPAAPVIMSVSPSSGPASGGTVVTIGGTGLSDAQVDFGLDAATNVACTATQCTATSPAGAGGATVDVRVTTAGGRSTMTAADRFTYGKAASRTTVTASPNPAAYGTAVTFTVSVTAGATGSVTVSTAGRTLCTTYPLFGGTASCSATTAPIGTDTITASYGGDAAYDGSAATATLTVRDVTKPSTKVTAPTAAFQLSKSVKATWTASDADSPSGIRYTVQYRRAAWNGGFGSYTQVLTKSTATSYTLTGTPGYDYCFRVQAVDASGNVSAWTPDRCTALPVDDRVLKATTSGWVRASDPAAYLGTVSTTATTGAKLTLSGVVADRLGLVVTECPTCGSIAIYRGATLWRTISTHATTTVHHVLIQLGTFSLGTVAVTTKRLTGSVRVDGLAVSRT